MEKDQTTDRIENDGDGDGGVRRQAPIEDELDGLCPLCGIPPVLCACSLPPAAPELAPGAA